MTPDAAIERLYDLKVDTTTRDGDGSPHEKPAPLRSLGEAGHKPLLLLSAFDLIDEGLAAPERIPCSGVSVTVAGIHRFSARFLLVRKLNDQNSPDLPFRYLASDGFWLPLEADGKTPIRREIRVNSGNDVSFIDAAHLIPFSESRNDHPSNGTLSRHSQRRRRICKNHHWAMDRDLIAPATDHHWHVSKLIDPRRSNGEKELAELAGKSVLLPKDPAFHPDGEGLNWRLERLIA